MHILKQSYHAWRTVDSTFFFSIFVCYHRHGKTGLSYDGRSSISSTSIIICSSSVWVRVIVSLLKPELYGLLETSFLQLHVQDIVVLVFYNFFNKRLYEMKRQRQISSRLETHQLFKFWKRFQLIFKSEQEFLQFQSFSLLSKPIGIETFIQLSESFPSMLACSWQMLFQITTGAKVSN